MSSLGLITLDIRKQRAVIAMHLPSSGTQYVPQPRLYPHCLSLPHSLFSLPLPSHVSPPFGQFNLRLSAKCKVMCDCIRRVCPPALAGIVFDVKAGEGRAGEAAVMLGELSLPQRGLTSQPHSNTRDARRLNINWIVDILALYTIFPSHSTHITP